MSTKELTSTNNLQALSFNHVKGQYTLWQIIAIWMLVALPMGFILWVVMPFLIPRVDINPGFLYFNLITLGLVWQGVVAYIILRREVKPFTWENIKARLWLFTPNTLKQASHRNGCTYGQSHYSRLDKHFIHLQSLDGWMNAG